MACFLVPTTEAIVTTVIKHAADKKGSDNIFIKKTAAANPVDSSEMLHEMFTSGVAMAVLVTLAWVVMVLISQAISKKKAPAVSGSTDKA